MQRLERAQVAVAGLGAVGSYAVEGLARAGVGRLRLVDFDVVKPSNLNRQLYALTSTVGLPKVDLAVARVRDLNPDCDVEGLPLFVHVDTLDRVLAGPPDLVVDAIDSLNPKVELISAAISRQIPLVSSMGAARRTDPALVRTGPFREAQGCRLARMVRRRLRRRQLPLDFRCVYSVEPMALALESPDEMDRADAIGSGRPRRLLGSLPTLTGIIGLTIAHEALRILLGGSLRPVAKGCD